jgi:hypothetical protein
MSGTRRWKLAFGVAACLCASAAAVHAQDTLAAAKRVAVGSPWPEVMCRGREGGTTCSGRASRSERAELPAYFTGSRLACFFR